jgi:hypothetical protein
VPALRSSIASRCRHGAAALVTATLLLGACKSLPWKQDPDSEEALPVKQAAEEVVVAAWSEPKQLPPAGGQAQIMVRAQKRGGAPFPGVEVRLRSSTGTLFSDGRVLVTDATGRTRDRLTSRRDTTIVVNAGGTVYRFRVPLHRPARE